MSRKLWIGIGLVALLVLNAILLERFLPRRAPWAEHLEKVQAEDLRKIREGRRAIPVFHTNEPLDLIGNLVTSRGWKEVLPLAEAQAETITKLDQLLRKARVYIWLTDADYPADNLNSYRNYLARSDARLRAAIRHGQRMVSLGLLTEPQAAAVTQRRLSRHRPMQRLYSEDVQELLSLTKEQREKLTMLGEEARAKTSHMSFVSRMMSPEPKVRHRAGAENVAISQSVDEAIMQLLTPAQLETWSQLTAERSLLTEPPELPALPETEAARIDLAGLSPIFQVLSEKVKALGLTADQRKLLEDLEEVTRIGLWWISQGKRQGPFPPGDAPNDPVNPISQMRAEFVKHAEQVVLLGILTENQARQVQAAVK